MSQIGTMLPDPQEMVDGLKETVQDLSDPFGIFKEEIGRPGPGRPLIEVMDDMEFAVKSKRFDTVDSLIEEGKNSTGCSWCQQKLNRTEIDVNYARGVCGVGSKEECDAGARVVAGKINNITSTLKMAAKDAINEIGVENHG